MIRNDGMRNMIWVKRTRDMVQAKIQTSTDRSFNILYGRGLAKTIIISMVVLFTTHTLPCGREWAPLTVGQSIARNTIIGSTAICGNRRRISQAGTKNESDQNNWRQLKTEIANEIQHLKLLLKVCEFTEPDLASRFTHAINSFNSSYMLLSEDFVSL